MAENHCPTANVLSSHALNELKKLVWGPTLQEDVFQRWSQGFNMSEHEPTALLQYEGGPCAVIAPVQAYLIKNAIFDSEGEWREVRSDKSHALLIDALRDILCQCRTDCYLIAFSSNEMPNELGEEQQQQQQQEESETRPGVENDGCKTEEAHFHSHLRLAKLDSTEQVEDFLKERFESFRDPYGVLLFLYSILFTKGIDQIKNEMEDPNEPLIDGTHGHGSQSLINLLLTGRAVSNVWDNDKDVSGLSMIYTGGIQFLQGKWTGLQGISKQPLVGFLTLLEHLRYCEVGWFLKCPQYPIWVLGSETHLTVLFSKERALCTPETPEAAARRIFKSFDPEGNNFISSVLLGDVLKALDLYADDEYVEMMKKKLDNESLGIILLSNFMEEFFPNERSSLPETFILYHYNGLRRSCPEQKVTYQEGQAMLMDFEVKMYSTNSPILTCLQTKWSGLEVEWTKNATPSLN